MHPSVGFPPVATPRATVLILGSLPGKLSLERGEYYAQPRNAFWPMMGRLYGASPELPYAERLRRLTGQEIALWDVCASAHRPGSLDSAIRHSTIVPNDFTTFLAGHRRIALICFNGAKAESLYRRKVLPGLPAPARDIRRALLPSTSPAHAAMRFDEKLRRWKAALRS
jgi:TDG/mug DNA glycosylase family protein